MMEREEQERRTIGSIAFAWWSALQPGPAGKGRGDPGALARLRRADLVGAAMEEATVDLARRLAAASKLPSDVLFERAALLAAVLAHVREHDPRKIAAVAGEKMAEDRPRLHPLRLRRLFVTHAPGECLTGFRRLAALLGAEVNVADLAQSLFDWPDSARGEGQRRRWAFEYYGASIATPEDHAAA